MRGFCWTDWEDDGIIIFIQKNDTGYKEVRMVTDREILEAVLAEVRGLGTRMDGLESRMDGLDSRMDGLDSRMDGLDSRMERMEKRQERFEEETRDNFADLRLHLENITDRNLSILAENHLNLINKMDVSATWMNRIMINEVKINALTDQVNRLQVKHS